MDEVKRLDQYFRAANYISACQLYLLDNPLLKRKLEMKDVKKKIVGHWGTVPGQNFIYLHLNRVIKRDKLNMIYISGPGHGGNAPVSNVYLEGTYSEFYPDITEDEEGLRKLFKQFSFPGGISSHAAPETPGSIHEGGELGYSLSHAFGAILDNKELIAACVVGDGEAETGPLATSWNLNKFVNPKRDGAVLPILHLNGYKISSPTVLGRMTNSELISLFTGYGWHPYIVEGKDTFVMHKKMMEVMDKVISEIKKIQYDCRIKGVQRRRQWPMIILKSPKGWTGPKEVDGVNIENTFRAHQVPITIDSEEKLELLEKWLKSYKPEELFDEKGALKPEIKELAPKGRLRMGSNPHANGGLLKEEIKTPNYYKYGIKLTSPGSKNAEDMRELGKYVRDLIVLNKKNNNFRVFSPDEISSNRLNAVFEVTNRKWNDKVTINDDYLSPDGKIVDSYLSEHFCEGALEGYLLTGRYGFFSSYEAFIRVVDSMASQHAKWLKVTKQIPWRAPIASLNYVLTSHCWQQDHNGYTHQDPGFLNHIVTKKQDIVRLYLPPDTNCLISCFDHCIKTENYVNVIVASKHERPQWLTMEEAAKHCYEGLSIWKFASNDTGVEPDIVMACAGDTPTLESLAATKILMNYFPDIKIRFVNVIDLMRLESSSKHPHGLTDSDYDLVFTKDKPIIFNFHGYPSLIHQLTYNRHNTNLHVHGYDEEGTITTPFDMRVQNEIDRYHIVIDAIKYLPKLGNRGASLVQICKHKLLEHKDYIKKYGVDMPEITNWKWKD